MSNETSDKQETPRVNAVVPCWQRNEIIDLARQLECELAEVDAKLKAALGMKEYSFGEALNVIDGLREAVSATVPMTLIEAWRALPTSCREGATTGYETFDQRGRIFFTLACQFVKQAASSYVGEKPSGKG